MKIIVLVLLIASISQTSLAYGDTVIQNVETYVANQTIMTQNVGTPEKTPGIWDSLVEHGIAQVSGIIGVGVAALVAWLRKKGIPVTTEQEKMFKEIVTKRFESLAKESWQTMRANPEKLDEYWRNDLSRGKIPQEFVNRLLTEGKDFAVQLKQNREFRDFAKKLSDKAMDKLLRDLRNQLKANYQRKMIDVIPKLVSIAVDATFDESVKDLDTWANVSLEKLKPLLVSAEAIDTQENLMIVIESEINKRIQQRTTT